MKSKEKTSKDRAKMIKIIIYFNTNKLATNEGKILRKHCKSSGNVYMAIRKRHKISSEQSIPFNSLLELPMKIEQVLINNEIKIHPIGKMKKYLYEKQQI